MEGKQQWYTATFEARVALDALREELTTAQLAMQHGSHHTMVREW